MSRGNDAIPSWSGFNFQGRMLLLCVIEDINRRVQAGKDISNLEVELEKREDFSIIDKNKYIALYQVKATLSKKKWEQYEEALNKLIKHKQEAKNTKADCVFVVAKNITNWGDNSNPYKNKISIYTYGGNIVGLNDVKIKAMTEIDKFLKTNNRTALNLEAVYGHLCIFLDEKISNMHLQGYKARTYRIAYSDFIKEINDSYNTAEAEAEYRINDQIYNHMISVVEDGMNEICRARCSKDFAECTDNCPAKVAVERILEFSDIREYCRTINPDKNVEWNKFDYVQFFKKKDIKHYILKSFLMSKSYSLVRSEKNIVGFDSELNTIPEGMLIPTLLVLEDDYKSIEDSTQLKLQNIKDNYEINGSLYGNSITVDSSYDLSDKHLSQAQINAAWDTIQSECVGSIRNDIGFVPYITLFKS